MPRFPSSKARAQGRRASRRTVARVASLAWANERPDGQTHAQARALSNLQNAGAGRLQRLEKRRPHRATFELTRQVRTGRAVVVASRAQRIGASRVGPPRQRARSSLGVCVHACGVCSCLCVSVRVWDRFFSHQHHSSLEADVFVVSTQPAHLLNKPIDPPRTASAAAYSSKL